MMTFLATLTGVLAFIALCVLFMAPILVNWAVSETKPPPDGFRLEHYQREEAGSYKAFDATECIGTDGTWLQWRVKA